jgi:hypothetical protein
MGRIPTNRKVKDESPQTGYKQAKSSLMTFLVCDGTYPHIPEEVIDNFFLIVAVNFPGLWWDVSPQTGKENINVFVDDVPGL